MKRLLVFVFAVVLLGSCSKNTEGCTDPNAINYNPDAVEDSGNCLFTLVGTWEGVSWIPNGNNISYKTMMGLHFIVTLIVLGIAIRFQTGMETITQITEEHIS